MKLLIKIYLENLNPYDLVQLLDAISNSISDKENTKIYLMTNDPNFDFEPYEYCYLPENSITKMINHNLDVLDWDIVFPIYKPCILAKNFDHITSVYKDKFPELDGVLLLNDIHPIIGRKYYENFGYVYNPIYKRKNFEEEFITVLKQSNKIQFYDKFYFKMLDLKLDDDNIYEMRKKFNFGL